MRADRFKQVAEELRLPDDRRDGDRRSAPATATARRLRVLMYHKVNDLPANPVTMPVVAVRRADGAARASSATRWSTSTRCSTHYVDGAPLPPRAVLITFDDGYHDNLDNAAPVLQQVRLPGGAVRSDRLPRRHACRCRTRSTSRRSGDPQPHGRLGASSPSWSAEGHPRSSRTASRTGRSPISRSTRPRARSRSRSCGSRSGSAGRCARSPTSRDRRRTTSPSTSRSCARPATTSRSPRSRARTRRRPTHCSSAATTSSRTPPRTFELVLAGACDLIALKDTVTGTHARRVFNAALGTSPRSDRLRAGVVRAGAAGRLPAAAARTRGGRPP